MTNIRFEQLSEEEQVARIDAAQKTLCDVRAAQFIEADISRLETKVSRLVKDANLVGYRVYELTSTTPNIILVGCSYFPNSAELSQATQFFNDIITERVLTSWDKFIVEGITHEIEPTEANLGCLITGPNGMHGEETNLHYASVLIRYLKEPLKKHQIQLTGRDNEDLIKQEILAWDLANVLMKRHGLTRETWSTNLDVVYSLRLAYEAMTKRSRDYWTPLLSELAVQTRPNNRVYMAVTLPHLVFGELTSELRERKQEYMVLVPGR